MVQKAGSAMEGVDKSIDKLQAPLDTVVRLSGTIDQVQESAVGAVKNMAGFMAGNLDSAKEAAAARTAKPCSRRAQRGAADVYGGRGGPVPAALEETEGRKQRARQSRARCFTLV